MAKMETEAPVPASEDLQYADTSETTTRRTAYLLLAIVVILLVGAVGWYAALKPHRSDPISRSYKVTLTQQPGAQVAKVDHNVRLFSNTVVDAIVLNCAIGGGTFEDRPNIKNPPPPPRLLEFGDALVQRGVNVIMVGPDAPNSGLYNTVFVLHADDATVQTVNAVLAANDPCRSYRQK